MKRILLLVTLGIAFWLLSGGDLLERYRFYRYDPALWSEAAPENRYYMARFLIDQHLLAGLSRQEVIIRLGKPDDDGESKVSYSLGPERDMFAMDGLVFDIYFDTEGVVSKARIRAT